MNKQEIVSCIIGAWAALAYVFFPMWMVFFGMPLIDKAKIKKMKRIKETRKNVPPYPVMGVLMDSMKTEEK